MTRNEYIASIMLEAADLLNESGGKTKAVKAMRREAAGIIPKDSAMGKFAQRTVDKADARYDNNTAKVAKLKAKYKDASPAGKAAIERQIQKAIKENRMVKNYPEYSEKETKRQIDRMNSDDYDWNHPYKSAIKEGRQAARNYKDFKKSNTPSRDEVRSKILKESVEDAIDLLYEKAALCEDVSDAEFYIEKADELQKAIEDIPEEKPVIQDEYDPDVNGGEGEEIDLEEIEDLCDGDQDVIDLLIDDEDKSVTVDASNESALDYFNLDW